MVLRVDKTRQGNLLGNYIRSKEEILHEISHLIYIPVMHNFCALTAVKHNCMLRQFLRLAATTEQTSLEFFLPIFAVLIIWTHECKYPAEVKGSSLVYQESSR